MTFLCDVHISYKIQKFLSSHGHTAIQVNELPGKSETPDKNICNYAEKENCILITKDADFADSYYLKQTPKNYKN